MELLEQLVSWQRRMFACCVVWLFCWCTGCWPPRVPEPARDGAGPCDGGQVSICLTRCVTPETAVGAPCSLDECAAGARICGPLLSCVPSQPGTASGTCQVTSVTCNPSQEPGSIGNRCPTGTVCVRAGNAFAIQQKTACVPQVSILSAFQGVCIPLRRDGESCDGTYEEAFTLQGNTGVVRSVCQPCAPSLLCWRNGSQGSFCRRECSGDPDAAASDASVDDYSLGRCSTDESLGAGRAYRCSTHSLDQSAPNHQGPVSRVLCTACSVSRSNCAPTVSTVGPSSLPPVLFGLPQNLPRFISVEEYRSNDPAQRLCCTEGELCLDIDQNDSDGMGGPICCSPPGNRCRNHDDCCGIPGFGSVCCGAGGLADALLCQGAGSNTCVTCGVSGRPCPPQTPCREPTDCGTGMLCQGGMCQPCPNGICCTGENVTGGRCGEFGYCTQGQCRRCGDQYTDCCPGVSIERSCRGNLGCVRPTPNSEERQCLPCGRASLPCCPTNIPNRQCVAGTACRSESESSRRQTCQLCGGENQICCGSPNAGTCTGTLVCDTNNESGRCKTCGTLNNPCCAGNRCSSSSLRCVPPTVGSNPSSCLACGTVGDRCCDNNSCNPGGVCINSRCEACGPSANPPRCCGTDIPGRGCGSLVCNSQTSLCEMCPQPCPQGTICDAQTRQCTSCGGNGQLCCTNGVCNGNLACSTQGNRCGLCGTEGQPCCQNESCQGNLTCSAGICRCGGYNQPCCGGQLCTSGLTCNNNQCVCGGGTGNPCCPVDANAPNRGCLGDSVCVRESVFSQGFREVCRPCGGGGQVCCANNRCRSPFPCERPVTTDAGTGGNELVCACGANGQWCCTFDRNSEAACLSGHVCDDTDHCVRQ